MLIEFIEDTNFINNILYCSIQDGISHIHYVGVSFVLQEQFLGFISDRICLQDFLWHVLEKHESRKREIIPLFGVHAHHETA